jgi:hypothetical protein
VAKPEKERRHDGKETKSGGVAVQVVTCRRVATSQRLGMKLGFFEHKFKLWPVRAGSFFPITGRRVSGFRWLDAPGGPNDNFYPCVKVIICPATELAGREGKTAATPFFVYQTCRGGEERET